MAIARKHSGGFCYANCPASEANKPITDERSSLVYLLNLSTVKPTVLEIFQYHSPEYPPCYIRATDVKHNRTNNQQCLDQSRRSSVKSDYVKNIIVKTKAKTVARGILTGNTEEQLKLLEDKNLYNLSHKAADTIESIRKFSDYTPYKTQRPFTPLLPYTSFTANVLVRFISDVDYLRKHKRHIRCVVINTHENPDCFNLNIGTDSQNYPVLKVLVATTTKSPKNSVPTANTRQLVKTFKAFLANMHKSTKRKI